MKRIYIIAIIASILAGISLFNYLLMVKKEARVDFEDVVIATADIEERSVITAEMVTTKQVPKDGIHPQAAISVNQAVGMISPEKIYKDEQILLPKLKKIGEKTGGQLSYNVPENMRAITVAVDEISGISGFINTGDHVDILGVITAKNGQENQQTSTMFLQNILVLAVGKSLNSTSAEASKDKDSKDAKSAYTSVTLLTTPNDAVRLNLLTTTGAMRIILRGPTDQATTSVEPKTSNNVSN